ncbi:fatty acyl-AMP ligase [Curtobacterium flaccumfaciens]|uniref:fatty acyl-AMP ligase n=1 Tax=Curtobacterium flaccumfaciens TaxID=2035 RepID=UPI001F01479F|nr:fatty acyl-AMP ligase [Curtobacterium flaccumfaciens]
MNAESARNKGARFHSSATESRYLSYPDLDRDARAQAVALRLHEVREHDRVVLAFPPGLDFLRAVYAAVYAGAVFVPAPIVVSKDAAAQRERVLQIASDAGARFVLTTPDLAEAVGGFGTGLEELFLTAVEADDRADAWVAPASSAEDLAFIQYTSGSTGDPKGVAITNANVVANQASIAGVMGYDKDSMLLGWLPHYHDMGLGLYLSPVFGGFDLVATSPAQFLRRPVLWLQLITQYRPTSTVAPDFAYNLCARLVSDAQVEDLDLSSLETVITGAEPVRWSTLSRFSNRFARAGFAAHAFVPAYGMAETTVLIAATPSAHSRQPLSLDPSDLEAGRVREVPAGEGKPVVLCGAPAPGHDAVIVDPDTARPAGDGEVGEIWVRGPSIARGYWQKPDATDEKFGGQLADGSGPYLRTGDLGFVWEGELAIVGRRSDVINVRGRNVYPNDLETAVAQAFSVDADVVSAAFEWADDVVAVVVEASSRSADDIARAESIRRDVAGKFSLEPLGLVVVRRGSIPRTSSGKVRRRATGEMLRGGGLPVLHSSGFNIADVDASTR